MKEFLDALVVEFEAYEKANRQQSNDNKKLWHFQYTGHCGDVPQFTKTLLSEKGTDRECYMTFDTVFNEHKELLKMTLDRLDDLEYYNKRGLNRKAGFTLYGPPGTSKTRTALCCALYSNRHMIQVQLSAVKTDKQLESIMNITSLFNIEITDRNSMLFFDEIDSMVERLSDPGDKKEMSIVVHNSILSDDDALKKKTNDSDPSQGDPLTWATLLSLLDPPIPRFGAFYLACSNNIEALPDALLRDLRMKALYLGPFRRCDAISLILLAILERRGGPGLVCITTETRKPRRNRVAGS